MNLVYNLVWRNLSVTLHFRKHDRCFSGSYTFHPGNTAFCGLFSLHTPLKIIKVDEFCYEYSIQALYSILQYYRIILHEGGGLY